MIRAHRIWTEADVATLRKLVAAGKTAQEAGAALGRHPETARSKAKAFDLHFVSGRIGRQKVEAPYEPEMPAWRPAPRHTSLTAAVMGDPPPGRSALDHKRAAQRPNPS